MVLPGIQALFGFQLIAVFNERFATILPRGGGRLHLLAVMLVAVAIALIMAPAAYHRLAERDAISRYFANFASRVIAMAMLALLFAISIEVSLVAYAIEMKIWLSVCCGAGLAILFGCLWFLHPMARRRSGQR